MSSVDTNEYNFYHLDDEFFNVKPHNLCRLLKIHLKKEWNMFLLAVYTLRFKIYFDHIFQLSIYNAYYTIVWQTFLWFHFSFIFVSVCLFYSQKKRTIWHYNSTCIAFAWSLSMQMYDKLTLFWHTFGVHNITRKKPKKKEFAQICLNLCKFTGQIKFDQD